MNKVTKTFGAQGCEAIDVTVHPSGRASDRVPFGTGPAVISNDVRYRTLEPIAAFREIKTLHDSIANGESIASVSPDVAQWLDADSFPVSTPHEVLRFYQQWDGLTEIRYIRERENTAPRSTIDDAVALFAGIKNAPEDRRALLSVLRSLR
jgi:hypothetical protein